MYLLLLAIIYMAFISLGLPDSVLGSAWPVMYEELGVSVSAMGILSMIISSGTIVSSMQSARVIRRFGTGRVTAVSVAMTAGALLGFTTTKSFVVLCLLGIPYGLGAGSVDAALNNYVALHYKSRHMSWLHCFWGVGAMIGPLVMGACLSRQYHWHVGYGILGGMQLVLTVLLFSTLFLWKLHAQEEQEEQKKTNALSLREILRIRGTKSVLFAFFCYCSVEACTGQWASSYLVFAKEMNESLAAKLASLFYIGITVGRFLCGFVSDRIGDRSMVRLGQGIGLGSLVLLLLPFGNAATVAGLIGVGLGCAPIYPSLIHATPVNFGAANSQAIIGAQMAFAYVGTTLIPPLFGAISEVIGIENYPIFLLVFAVMMILATEQLNRSCGGTPTDK